MNQRLHPSQVRNQSFEHCKTMLATVFGAVLGCGMTLLAYDTLLGGATQAEKLSQIERTVEHNRVVDEQALALLRSMGTGTEAANATAKGAVGLSKRPTDRELTDAIDGLFEGLDEGTPSSVDQTAGKPVVPVQAAAVKGDLIEAAKEQPAGEQQKADGKADSK